jgi:predicted PurR-regulated permease PerM
MGRGLKTLVLVILVGVIGGTLACGITGLFLGPIVLGPIVLGPIVLAVVWELFVSWIEEKEASSRHSFEPNELRGKGTT